MPNVSFGIDGRWSYTTGGRINSRSQGKEIVKVNTKSVWLAEREVLWDKHFQKICAWLKETKGDSNARYSNAELEEMQPDLYKEYMELSDRTKGRGIK